MTLKPLFALRCWKQHRKKWLLLFFLLIPWACKQRQSFSDPTAVPEFRKVIGPAVPWRFEDEVDEAKAKRSMAYRRGQAWAIVRSMTKNVSIGVGDGLPGFKPDAPSVMPLWQTFYESDEFLEMFSRLYVRLGPDGRRSKARFCPADLDVVFQQHAGRTLRGWTPELLEQRLSQIKTAKDVLGVSGRGVTLFSPGILRHYLENYNEVLACQDHLAQWKPETKTSRDDNFTPCFRTEFPGPPTAADKNTDRLEHCELQGGSGHNAAGTAVAIKSTWHAVGTAEVAVFDTSAEGMRRLLNGKGEWTPERTVSDKTLSAQDVFTIQLKPNNREYQLHGIHFTTKDVRDWMWITLWWSPEPDTDFGADRPKDFAGTPWANYKMCVTSHFEEADPAPWSHYEKTHPDLASALKVVHEWGGPYTWCSNPYTELGLGNAKTNCVGCHQHAGVALNTDEIFLDDPSDPKNPERRAKFPHNSRKQIRQNFPGDYLWSFSHGPDFFEAKIRGKTYEVDLTDR